MIGDTGSTDGTQEFVKSFFAERGVPGELHAFPFVNFKQARNAALDFALASALDYDYLLFCDADVVDAAPLNRSRYAFSGRLLRHRVRHKITRRVRPVRHSRRPCRIGRPLADAQVWRNYAIIPPGP